MNEQLEARLGHLLDEYWPNAQLDAAFTTHARHGWHKWGTERRLIGAEQLALKLLGFEVGEIDGLVGPQTEFAREDYAHWSETGTRLVAERPEADVHPEPDYPSSLLTNNNWPRQRDCPSFYGHPASLTAGQMVRVEIPWTAFIAWDIRTRARTIAIHPKCAASLERVLHAIRSVYSDAEIKSLGLNRYAGSYNKRQMRGGSAWSMHAYGCAIDWDSARNGLHTKAPHARLSHEDAITFWRCWEEEDWVSLGRARNFDWMHVQAARL